MIEFAMPQEVNHLLGRITTPGEHPVMSWQRDVVLLGGEIRALQFDDAIGCRRNDAKLQIAWFTEPVDVAMG